MKVTFIMGNGLDLSVGLKTGYSDFYKAFLATDTGDPAENRLKDAIRASIENGDKTWADFELALGRFTSEFSSEEEFLDCYDSGVRALTAYLKETYQDMIESDYYFLESVGEGLRDFATDFYRDLEPNEVAVFDALKGSDSVDVGFVTLNYTPLVEDALEEVSAHPTRGDIIHAHGTLKMYPIVGVNDSDQIDNRSFHVSRVLQTTMIKSQSDQYIGKHWGDDARKMIDGSDVVCIYGCSLGDTDAEWWNFIAKWLAADRFDNDRKLVIFWHSALESNSLSVRRLMQINAEQDAVKERFCARAREAVLGLTEIPEDMDSRYVGQDEIENELKNKIIVDCKPKKLYRPRPQRSFFARLFG